MAKEDRVTYKKRAFLNPDEGIAAVTAKVKVIDSATYTEVTATLTLTDCSDNVNLDFDVWESSEDKRYLNRRRKKVALLRKTINDFLDAVETAYDEIEEKAPAKAAEAKRLKEERKKKKRK